MSAPKRTALRAAANVQPGPTQAALQKEAEIFRPLCFSKSKPYKSIEAPKIDAAILKRVEIEIRKITRRRTLSPRGSGSEDARVDDLRSAAYLAVVRARDKFDPSRGFQFWTFAETVVRNAILDAVTPKTEDAMGGRHRLLDIDQPVKTEDGEGLTLPDVLADTDPNPFGESFWRTLRPLLPERHFIVLLMRCRELKLKAVGAHLGVSYQRVQQIGSAALKDVQRIVATNPVARRALLAPMFYAAEVAAGNRFVQQPSPRAGFERWLAGIHFEAERWARGSDPLPKYNRSKLSPFRNVPSVDALYHVVARTWQDAATCIAAQAAVELGVQINPLRGRARITRHGRVVEPRR